MTYEQLLEKIKADLLLAQVAQVKPFFTTITWVHWVILAVMAVGLLALILGTFYTVKNNHFVVVERFGKYIKTSQPGLHFKIPFIDRVSSAWNMAIFEQLVEVETITSDKVSVVLEVPVQFQVIQGREVDAVYKLGSRKERIESLVFDEVRSRVPKLSLDQLFNSKDDIAVSVREDLKTDLIQFGYDINRVMITDVEPDAKVKEKMNEVNASLKEGEAMLARATNEQRVQVANAEGRLKAATLNRDAELIDAEAVAKSVEIIGKALHDNTGYLQWKWIHMMEERDSGDTIYVPTEAGLPILEAGKRSTTKTYPDCND